MGSDVLTNRQFQTVLEENPELISWSSLREVILHRGKTGKLGFKVHTLKGIDQTYTVVTKVKTDCQVWKGKLKVFDRIICINNTDICQDDGSHALKLLSGSCGPYVKLLVCQPDRFRIVAAEGTSTTSQDSSPDFTTLHVPSRNIQGNIPCSETGDESDTAVEANVSKLNILDKANNNFSLKNKPDIVKRNLEQTDYTSRNRIDQSNLISGDIKNGNAADHQHYTQNALNDLSKANTRDIKEKYGTNKFSVVPNICSLNSQSSQNTCSTNQSFHSNSDSYPLRDFKLNSDSSGEIRSNTELVDSTIGVSNNHQSSPRTNTGFSFHPKLTKDSSRCQSGGSKSQRNGLYSLISSDSQSSRHSGESIDSMGKSKGDKIVKKFYKGNSQDSNDASEELEPLKLGDSVHHHGKGKVDSRYTHVNDDDRTLSVPLTKEVALSVQDIVFDESSQTIPFVTEPNYINNCPCATCVVTSGICQSCGSKPGSSVRRSPSHMVSLVPETTEGLLPENYGPFLLKNPHLALWDGAKTRVVEIDRGTTPEFPFSYKVKMGKNQDASVEIYTLVESLLKGGPACGKLNIGDWIRSVNGTPIQLPMDAFSLLSNNNRDTSLRLVIQRPVGFSQQPGSSSSPPCSRTEKGDKSPQDVTPKSPQELTPTSPLQSPLFSISSRELQEPLLPDTHLPGRIEVKKSPGTVDKKEPRKIYIQNINKEENESDSWNTPFPRVVKLPKVRMFICGSEAEKCASLILHGSELSCDNLNQGYAYFDCSMATNSYGSVVISASCSNLYATSLSLSNMSISSMNQSESSTSEKEDMKCRHCGNEYHCSASHTFVGTVANVEVFVVSDEKFFHNCCTYLFTKYSIFVLTFDGAKLLRSATVEISRMQSLSHTIRSFAGYDCHIMSCGLLDSGTESKNMADEVRTLFYTSSVSMLQIFNVMGPPELIDVGSNSASSDSLNGSRQLQSLIWKVVTETIQRQHILQPCLIIMDHLNSIRDHELFLTESQMMEIVRTRLPQYQQDVHQMVVTEMSMCGEIVSGKAAPITLSHLQKTENLVLIEPKAMVGRLYSAISAIADDRQRWAKVHSYGLVEIQDFVRLCAESETGNQYMAEFMESYGLIFRHFAGQTQQMEYFLPYFAVTAGSSENISIDKKDHVLYMQFKSHGSTQLFFHLLFNIASHTDSPKSFTVQTVSCCNFRYNGMVCISFHQKLEDRIVFLFKREDKSKSIKLPDLYIWLLSVCQRTLAQDIQFVLGAPCPLGDSCHTSSSPALHIIDLHDSKPQYCGRERIDLLKPVKAWRPKPNEVEKPVSSQQKPVFIMDLKYTTLHRVWLKLKIQSALGRDWRGLAGLMGLTAEEVDSYETFNNPPRELLREWSNSGNGTVDELIKLLSELEREDIVSEIKEALSVSPLPSFTVTPPPTGRAKEETFTPNKL